MKKYIAILLLIFLSACVEIEVKTNEIDPYADDPAGIVDPTEEKEQGITIK